MVESPSEAALSPILISGADAMDGRPWIGRRIQSLVRQPARESLESYKADVGRRRNNNSSSKKKKRMRQQQQGKGYITTATTAVGFEELEGEIKCNSNEKQQN